MSGYLKHISGLITCGKFRADRWNGAYVYWLLVLLYSYERELDRLSTREREKNASCMIAPFATEYRNLGWQPSPINPSQNHAIIYFIDCAGDEMKREVHSECHREKGSEGSRKGEIYARRHAKFRHFHQQNLRISRALVGWRTCAVTCNELRLKVQRSLNNRTL